jgi:hypothetical protein
MQSLPRPKSLFYNAECNSGSKSGVTQGCQMVYYFQTKNINLGKFLDGLRMEMLVNLVSFGIFYGHLVISWSYGIFSPVLVYCVKKNLATLV